MMHLPSSTFGKGASGWYTGLGKNVLPSVPHEDPGQLTIQRLGSGVLPGTSKSSRKITVSQVSPQAYALKNMTYMHKERRGRRFIFCFRYLCERKTMES